MRPAARAPTTWPASHAHWRPRWRLGLALALAAAALPAAAQTANAVTTAPPLELLAPRAEPGTADATVRTSREFIHLLGRTEPGARVRLSGEGVDEDVQVHATGIFARDRIPLQPGLNRLRLSAAATGDGPVQERMVLVERVAPPAPVQWPSDRLYVNGASLQPAEAVQVAPGETVEVAVQATPGQRVQARLGRRGPWQALVERADRAGHYRARLSFAGSGDVAAAPVQLRVRAGTTLRGARPRSLNLLTPGSAGQWRADADRLVRTGPDGAELLHGLHEVRLGGPYLAELPPGVLLPVVGRQGAMLKLRLAEDTTAWVHEASVQAAPAGTPAPHAVFTSVALTGGDGGDTVQVPLAAPVPYAVRAVADAQGRQSLEVDIYGSHLATTWVSQRASARVVRSLDVAQAAPGRVRLRITPAAGRLAGWRVERTPAALRIELRQPPVPPAQGSPLAGLRVALEAGHGSPANLGAVGATGVPEKDINRWTVEALQAELEGAGAQVVMVRAGDDNPTLRERAQRVLAADAQLFVSVHANASDTALGYLRTSGVSTYFKHEHARGLAAAVQARLLQATGLADFGLVGNFNYTPIRLVSWAPAVLVEQAFVSHPGDEARLLDPAFRAQVARAVRQGLEDYLRLW